MATIYTGGEVKDMEALFDFVDLLEPDFPRINKWASKTQPGYTLPSTGYPGTWSTIVEETSGGPWMVLGARNDPNFSNGSIQLRITVDGTLLATSGLLSYINTNFFIGHAFGIQGPSNFCPVMCRTSFKLEGRQSTGSNQYVDTAYCGYDVG